MTSSLEDRQNILAQITPASNDDPSARHARPLVTVPRQQRAQKRQNRILPRRIGLFGLFGSGNSGNDGSLEAMLAFLRQVRPDAHITCFCACNCGAAAQIVRDFQLPTIPFAFPKPASGLPRMVDRLSFKVPRQLASLVRAFLHARRLDVLIFPGTGILDDFGSGPTGMPLVLFGWCLSAKLCGTPIAFVSIGAGPIHHPVSRWLMRSAVAMAQYRSYRDTISKSFMESIGFDTRKDAVYPDIAFKLPAPPSSFRPQDTKGPLTVGVGVMNYHGWHNDRICGAPIRAAYLEKITKFVLWLLDRGHPVRILMGDAADQQVVDDVATRVATARPQLPEDRLLADPMQSLHDLMRQLAQTDLVVATRFHNVVCALKLGKPTVSIGYAEKNDVLMAEMGLGRFCQYIERLDLDLLIEQFTQLLADRQGYEEGIRRTNLLYQECLGLQDELLASRLLWGPPGPRAAPTARRRGCDRRAEGDSEDTANAPWPRRVEDR